MDDSIRNPSEPINSARASQRATAHPQGRALATESRDGSSKGGSSKDRGHAKEAGGRPIFDFDRSLARLGGDIQLLTEIAVLFLEDSPQLLEQARRGLADGDVATVARAAHSLQGLSANFEAVAMAAAANIVEQHTRDRDLQSAAACFPTMEAELGRLQAALARIGLPKESITDLPDGRPGGSPA